MSYTSSRTAELRRVVTVEQLGPASRSAIDRLAVIDLLVVCVPWIITGSSVMLHCFQFLHLSSDDGALFIALLTQGKSDQGGLAKG